jgi:hypothetical protein
MPGQITTHSHCAVINNGAYEGTKAEIVNQLYEYSIGKDRVLRAKFIGRVTITFHSYQDEFTDEEMHKDAIEFLYSKLPMFGVRLYRDIGI